MKSHLFWILALLTAFGVSCRSTGANSRPEVPPTVSVQATSLASETPSEALPTPNCVHEVTGGFGDVWRNEQVWPHLGCAVAPAEGVNGTEVYWCDGTHSLWLKERELFVVIRVGLEGWQFVADESNVPAGTALMEEPAPRPEPCFEMRGRHGWLAEWLGREGKWARTSETAFDGVLQQFEGGWLLWNGNVCFVLFEGGRWTMF